MDLTDRLVVRKVSPYLRDVIDEKKPEVQKLFCCLTRNSSRLHYENIIENVVMYSKIDDKCKVEYGNREHVIEKGDHLKLSINDLAIVLKNPKLRLDELCINLMFGFDQSLVNKYSKEIQSIFEPLHHQIHTKDVTITILLSFLDATMSFLPFIKPGTLESISFRSHNNHNPAMEEIVKLEQWKQAKSFDTNRFWFSASIEHLFHFNEFYIHLQSISLQDMNKIRDVLLRSPNFKIGTISMSEYCNVDELKQIFESGIPLDPNGPIDYKVPNSDNAFRVFILLSRIEINKIVL